MVSCFRPLQHRKYLGSWGRFVQVQEIESLVEEEKRKANVEKRKEKKKRLFPYLLQIERTE